MKTNWNSVERSAREKSHAAEVAALKQELDVAKATLERTRTIRPQRVAKPRDPARRMVDDVVRVVIPDTHGALVDKAALAALLADIKALDPHEIILLGDHVDCGGFLALHHVMGYVAETDYTYEEDLAAAASFLDALAQAAPRARVEYIEGNHERRVETWCVTQTLRHGKDAEGLRRLLSPEFRLNLATRGIAYYRQGVFYDGLPVPGVIKRGKCFFFHGVSTAKNAVAATQDRIGGNCVFGHTHRAQSDITRRISSGIVGAWNPGCLCSLQPLWQHTAPTNWTHGYSVQLVAASGAFLHLNIPIIDGVSNFAALFKL
jgi:predicted phosphodiesterase